MSERVSTVYIERAVVSREDNAVVLIDDTGEVHLPAAMVASLLLGPGSKITHGAMRLLGDSGTTVCWVGENGVRMYGHAVATAQTSRYLIRQAWLVSDTKRRTQVARHMYAMRFPGEDITRLTIQQLRGREGARVRRAYRLHSSRTGVNWQGRKYIPGKAHAAGDDVNRLLSAANACLYGICHAAIVGLGASPALGFVHTGTAISFVLDVADLYKAIASIPVAFDLAAEGLVEEQAARHRIRDLIVREGLMDRVVRDVRTLLLPREEASHDLAGEPPEQETAKPALWDGEAEIPSGRNWATDEEPPPEDTDWSIWQEDPPK